MLATTSIARSESFSRSRVSPRVVKVSGTKPFSSPSAEVFASASLHVSNSEHAQTRNINLKTSQPFVLDQAPRSLQANANPGNNKGNTSERPSTSSGTSTLRQWNRIQWENINNNRISRDDMYLMSISTSEQQNKVDKLEATTNSFPMPTAPPTPDATPPRGPSPEERLIGELTHMKEQDQDVSMVGMALGSPTHPQQYPEPSPYQVNTNDQAQEWKQPNEVLSPISPAARQKQSKWKGFGSLFGRKTQKPSAFYQLDGTPQSGNSPVLEQNTHFGNSTPPDSADTKSRGRSHTTTSKKPAKPAPTRANTVPADQKRGWSKKQEKKSQGPEIQVDGGPMLDVEIPSIQLDRYSVMFSGVLGQNGTESASSLLARRQATLDKLKHVNEAIAQKEKEEIESYRKLHPRRATSPQPTKSPAFSLFPTTVGTPSHPVPRTPSPLDHLRPLNYKSGLSRSNTSPAALSPNRSTFNSDAESHIIMLDDGKSRLNGISNRSGVKKNVQFSTQESVLILSPHSTDSRDLTPSGMNSPWDGSRMSGSSDEEDNEEEIHVQSPLKPRLNEPDWQIINPSEPKSVAGSGPFKKEMELIDKLTSPTTEIGRSATVTQSSSTSGTRSTAQSSLVASPTSDIQHPMSPLRSNPPMSPYSTGAPTPQSHSTSQRVSPEPHHKYSSSVSTSSTSTSNAGDTPRRARSIKEIRADMKQRQASLSRSAQREQQREIERAKVQEELDEAERTLESAAELSIARQISMSQKQRQLLKPIQTKGGIHRKPIGTGSIHSFSSSISEQGKGAIRTVPAEGFGNNMETDAILLSSGGFNNPIPNISSYSSSNYTTDSPSQSQSLEPASSTGGFDFNHYERPTGAGIGATTISAATDANTRIRNAPISIGAIGMGAVLKREVSGATPTIVEPEFAGGKGLGHRYQRSERVVLDG